MLGIALRFPLLNTLFLKVFRYLVCRKINFTTHGRFPAPHAAFDAILSCWLCSTGTKHTEWPYHFSVDASSCSPESRAFGRVVVSAESKALISLFLSSKLPSKLSPPLPLPSVECASTNRVAISLSNGGFTPQESRSTALIVALLLSGISVKIALSSEEFKGIFSATSADLKQRVCKQVISAAVMVECVSRLQHVHDISHLDDDELLLCIGGAPPQHQQAYISRAGVISCGARVHFLSGGILMPSLCHLNWSGGNSNMAEVIIGCEPIKLVGSNARAASAAAAVCRASGYGVVFTSSNMSASFEVFCSVFARAVFIVACSAASASEAVSAVEVVDLACISAGWDAGPFELADKLGPQTVLELLVEFISICERCGQHVGKGLRAARRIMETLSDSTSNCFSFWSWSPLGKRLNVNSGIGLVIKNVTRHDQMPQISLDFFTDYFIHLHILMAAAQSCRSLLQRQAVPNPEILDLLLVAAGYPANQGGVLECARNTFALSDYEYIINSFGADALDGHAWCDAYEALFEGKIFPDRPQTKPCLSVSRLSHQSSVARKSRCMCVSHSLEFKYKIRLLILNLPFAGGATFFSGRSGCWHYQQ
jgi:hypothetical protein